MSLHLRFEVLMFRRGLSDGDIIVCSRLEPTEGLRRRSPQGGTKKGWPPKGRQIRLVVLGAACPLNEKERTGGIIGRNDYEAKKSCNGRQSESDAAYRKNMVDLEPLQFDATRGCLLRFGLQSEFNQLELAMKSVLWVFKQE